MSRYEGDGEFVAGAFRSIRAFLPKGYHVKEFSALTYGKRYQVGVEYKAECERPYLDPVKVSEKYGIPVLNDLYVGAGRNYHLLHESTIRIKSKTLDPIEIELSVLDYNNLTTKHTHEAPQRGCQCGFYSFYDKDRMFDKSHLYIPIPVMCVFGVVENSGRIVHCEYGLRSEKMKILGIAQYDHGQIDALIEKFPLDVFEG